MRLRRQACLDFKSNLLLTITFWASKSMLQIRHNPATRVPTLTLPKGLLTEAVSIWMYFKLTLLPLERTSIDKLDPRSLESIYLETWSTDPKIRVQQDECSGNLRVIRICQRRFYSRSQSLIAPFRPSSQSTKFLIPVSPSISRCAQSSHMVSTFSWQFLLVRSILKWSPCPPQNLCVIIPQHNFRVLIDGIQWQIQT